MLRNDALAYLVVHLASKFDNNNPLLTDIARMRIYSNIEMDFCRDPVTDIFKNYISNFDLRTPVGHQRFLSDPPPPSNMLM